MRDKVHESVCDAAGWKVRCDKCGGYTKRGSGVMICRDQNCQKQQEDEIAEKLQFRPGWDYPIAGRD